MDLYPVLKVALAAIPLAAYAAHWWLDPRRRARRALGRVPESRLANVKDGERARVSGVARVDKRRVTSPVGGRSCIGFHLIVEENASGSASNWRPVLVRWDCAPFLLADGDVEALVEGQFQLGLDPDDRGDVWANLPPALFTLLEETKVSLTGPFGRERELRFKEARLEAGDRLSVLGRFAVEPSPDGARRSPRGTPLRFLVRGSASEPVIVTDAADPAAIEL